MNNKHITGERSPNQILHAYSTGLLQGTAYSRLHLRLTRALSAFSISIPQWKLLGQLYEHGDMRLSHLALRLSYDSPMVTKLAKQLEKKALLNRKTDKQDERGKIVSITTKGKEFIIQAEPVVKKEMNTILQGVSKTELLIYLKVLDAIVRNTEE